MANLTMEQRAERGRKVLGVFLPCVMGVFIFMATFRVVVLKDYGIETMAVAFGMLLVVLTMQGQKGASVVLGSWLLLLCVGHFFRAGTALMSGRTSEWTPFVLLVGCIYLITAVVLLTFYDIQAREIVKHRERMQANPVSSHSRSVSIRPHAGGSSAVVERLSAPVPSAPPATASAGKTTPPQFPFVCTACGRLSPAGAISCRKCGKPFPAVRDSAKL
jgi:hypothetical protein